MKKSLILSIVMTLVLVISMSTATFAWYTSQGTVTASVNTITAATAGGTLQVKMGEDAYGSNVSVTANGVLNPSAPTATLTYANAGTSVWSLGTQNAEGVANLELNKAGSYITGTITLQNAGESAISAVTISAAVTDIANFEANDTAAKAAAEYILIDTTTASSETVVINTGYDITADASTKGAAQGATATATITDMAAGAVKTYTYYIWLNGWEALNTASAGQFNVVFTFSSAA